MIKYSTDETLYTKPWNYDVENFWRFLLILVCKNILTGKLSLRQTLSWYNNYYEIYDSKLISYLVTLIKESKLYDKT